ncbi:MAG: hypothetical protein AAF389_13385 [Gemmatimonadota bacterium]
MSSSNRTTLIPWARVALEGLVIVASILMAFGIDRWWERQEERGEIQAALGTLHADMVVIQDLIAGNLSAHRRARAASDELGRRTQEALRARTTAAVPDSLIILISWTPTLDPPTGGLESLSSSGRLAVLDDPEFEAELRNWSSRLGDVVEDERVSQGFMLDRLGPLLSAPPPNPDGLGVALRAGFDWLFGGAEKPVGSTVLAPSSELAYALATHSIWIATAEVALETLDEQTERLRAELESRLAATS